LRQTRKKYPWGVPPTTTLNVIIKFKPTGAKVRNLIDRTLAKVAGSIPDGVIGIFH
jgi:hypothetical protein